MCGACFRGRRLPMTMETPCAVQNVDVRVSRMDMYGVVVEIVEIGDWLMRIIKVVTMASRRVIVAGRKTRRNKMCEVDVD